MFNVMERGKQVFRTERNEDKGVFTAEAVFTLPKYDALQSALESQGYRIVPVSAEASRAERAFRGSVVEIYVQQLGEGLIYTYAVSGFKWALQSALNDFMRVTRATRIDHDPEMVN